MPYRHALARQEAEAKQRADRLHEQYISLMAAVREEGPAGHLLDLQAQLAAICQQCSKVVCSLARVHTKLMISHAPVHTLMLTWLAAVKQRG